MHKLSLTAAKGSRFVSLRRSECRCGNRRTHPPPTGGLNVRALAHPLGRT